MTHDPALTQNLMERICEKSNLRSAYRKVVSNRGAAGVDRMTVDELHAWTSKNIESLKQSLLDGSYQPRDIRAVPIPKPSGGIRTLGIPTVIDRFVQQAILQVLQPLCDPYFSDHSYGFRPLRSAHQALQKAQGYVAEGFAFVVDMDLEKFFDKVNHDILMDRLSKRFQDKVLLRLIRRFITAGMMQDGLTPAKREEGMPQGSPLSPLLSNILLDELDKELEKRGHRFVRFADDCNVYVQSQRSAERVLGSLEGWLWQVLRLKVNRQKSAAGRSHLRKFLGYKVHSHSLWIAPESIARFKDKVRRLTARLKPHSIEERVEKLNQLLIGWFNYFRLGASKTSMRTLDQWIRRRIRCLKLHQLKRTFQRVAFLKQRGLSSKAAWMTMQSGKGCWRLAISLAANLAMDTQWFEELRLVSLKSGACAPWCLGTAGYDEYVRWCERSRPRGRSYSLLLLLEK